MFGNILGSFNPLASIIGTALGGPLGAVLAQALQQVVSQVVQEIIQKAGEQLGLPQQFIDMAQGAAAGSLGDTQGATRNLQEAVSGFVGATGATGAAAGALQREATNVVDNFVQNEVGRITRAAGDRASAARGGGGEAGAAAPSGIQGGSGSVLMRIAQALGEMMDNKTNQMADKADKLGSFGSVDGKNMAQYNKLSSEMSALSQELKIIGEALNNTLKGIGDASSALARRQ
jgi:hypothetical protein